MLLFVDRLIKQGLLAPAGIITLVSRNIMHKVFVYGTLKRNEPNHHWLTNPSNGTGCFVSEGRTKEKYPLVIATKYNIPFMLYCPGRGHNIEGEIYEVDDKMLCQLDILEDHPNFYIRDKDNIEVCNNSKTEIVKCWVYFIKDFKPRLLDLPNLTSYSSSGSHGLKYKERSCRDPNYDHRTDIFDKISK